MQAFTLVLNAVEFVEDIVNSFEKAGFEEITVIDSVHTVNTLHHHSVEPPAIFGSLRMFARSNKHNNKVVRMIVRDEDVPKAVSAVKAIVGELKMPEVGYLYTTPIAFIEGLE